MDKYRPVLVDTVEMEGKLYPAGYKVVTDDLRSLGMKNNHNVLKFDRKIFQYPIGQWYFFPEELFASNDDYGGIWVARTLSNAKRVKDGYEKRHHAKARIFRTVFPSKDILFANDYRIKTSRVLLLEEVL